MWQLLLFFLDVLLGSCGSHSAVVYQLPKKVEVSLGQWLNNKSTEEQESVYFFLDYSLEEGYDFCIYYCEGLGKGVFGSLASRSNHVIVIDNKAFPLLFGYDEMFALHDDQKISSIGPMGRRDGTVKRARQLLHSKPILFNAIEKKDNNCIYERNTCQQSRDNINRKTNKNVLPNNSTIVYVFPDAMEEEIYEMIKETKVELDHVIKLFRDESGTIRYECLSVIGYESDRYALIDDDMIPLLFDFDDCFLNKERYEKK